MSERTECDGAYSEAGLSDLDADTRELFELVLREVGVAPSLRHRARLNLLIKLQEGGRESLDRLVEEARERRRKLVLWLEKYEGERAPSKLE